MSAMNPEVFYQFIDQSKCCVYERLILAKADVITNDWISDDILNEIRGMGIFSITVTRGYGGSGMIISQPASRRTAGSPLPRTMTLNEQFREMRLYQVAPISMNMILPFVAEHALGLSRSC